MANLKGMDGGLEWTENMPDGTSRKLEPAECGTLIDIIKYYYSIILSKCNIFLGLICRSLSSFFKKAYYIARSEPKKVIHSLKVGVALSIVSFFYYLRPLYDGVGGNAMWAVMTVVVVFEYTVGQTLSKCINRTTGTFLAGSLGIGVHWVATRFGENYEPVIVGLFVFLLASSATFSRFIPTIKATYDYGAMIFILTFSLVSVSGYRVDTLIAMAQDRLLTIAIGTSICIIISTLIFPVWAGSELHLLVHRNLDKLADSLDGCVEEYFDKREGEKPNKELDDDSNKKKMLSYKCVLNSKATEDSMANFARWEPAHGDFNFRHPWKQYLKISAQMRSCACCIESLTNVCIMINSEPIQAPEILKGCFSDICKRLSSHCSKVMKESSLTIKTMKKSSTIDYSLGEMNFAVQQLQNTLKSFPNELLLNNSENYVTSSSSSSSSINIDDDENTNTKKVVVQAGELNLVDILPHATATSLLIEIAGKVEGIVDAIDELADLAKFKPAAADEKSGFNETDHDQNMKVFQEV